MTLPRFGRIVPLQGEMLELAGYVLSRDPNVNVIPASDAERIAIMQRGRTALVRRTGWDGGYDLADWVRFLEADERHRDELTHPYAYRTTMRWIQEAIVDSDRQRLIAGMAE